MGLTLTVLSVVVYQVACTLFWPTPSEAPLLAGWTQAERLSSCTPARIVRFRDWVRDRLVRYGFPAYFVTQAIPFMPMRTGLYVYAGVARSWRPVVLGIAVGALVRNLLMLGLVLGVTS